jgi:1-acyl-sn-glycerol-3-phosphate acyltransferase
MSPGLIRALLITDPLIILFTIILGTWNLIVSFFDHGGHHQVKIARVWSRILIFIAGIKMEVHGREKIDPSGSYVFAANHASYMDTPVVLAHIPVQFRFMAKAGLFRVPFLGFHLTRAGHVPVPRENPREAIKAMAEAGRYIRERGISMVLFPEGGRSITGLQPFKEGAAYIAIKAGVPIVPVALDGTLQVLPMHSLNVRPGRVALKIGDPIPTAHLTPADKGRLTQQVYDQVAEMLEGTPSAPRVRPKAVAGD